MAWVDKDLTAEDIAAGRRSKGFRPVPTTNFGQAGNVGVNRAEEFEARARLADQKARDEAAAADSISPVGAIASGAIQGIQVADVAVQDHLASQVAKEVEAAEKLFFGMSTTADADTFRDAPEGLKGTIRTAEGANSALLANRPHNPQHFYSLMHSKMKEAQAKYPGWADKIESYFTKNLGFNPSNRIRQALIAQSTANAAAQTQRDKSVDALFTSFAKAGIPFEVMFPGEDIAEVRAGMIDGTYDKDKMFQRWNKVNQLEFRRKNIETMNELYDAGDTALVREQEQYWMGWTTTVSSNVLDAFKEEEGVSPDNSEGDSLSGRYGDWLARVQASGGNPSPALLKEGQELADVLRTSRAQLIDSFSDKIRTDDPLFITKADPKIIERIQSNLTKPIDDMIANIETGDHALIPAYLANRELDEKIAENNIWMSLDTVEKSLSSIKKFKGEDFALRAQRVHLQQKYGDVTDNTEVMAYVSLLSMISEGGDSNLTMDGVLQRNAPMMKNNGRAPSRPVKGQSVKGTNHVPQRTVEMVLDLYKQTKQPQLFTDVVRNMVGDGKTQNEWWLSLPPQKKKEMMDVFQSEDFFQMMSESKDERSKQKFGRWLHNQWLAQNKLLLDEAVSIDTRSDKIKLDWNAETGELVVVDAEDLGGARKPGNVLDVLGLTGPEAEAHIRKEAEEDIAQLNDELRVREKFLGLTVNNPREVLAKSIEAFGAMPGNQPRVGSFFTVLGKLISRKKKEENSSTFTKNVDQDKARADAAHQEALELEPIE